MPKRFTLAEAQRLIPQVSRRLREAVALKTEYADAERAIHSSIERIMMMGGMVVDRKTARETRDHLEAASSRLRAAIEQVQELGCVVKDLDMGLVDFPTLLGGVEVCLCWKLGETEIGFWHGTDEGFAGRKPIDEDFLRQHRGDPAQ